MLRRKCRKNAKTFLPTQYNIQYSTKSVDYLPQSLVLKLSRKFPYGTFTKMEPEFYLNFEPRISNIKIPKSYYVTRRPYSFNEYLLLLEDLSINYDSLGSRDSLEDSTLFSVIASMASLHVEFFKHPLLRQKTFAWLPSLNSSLTYYRNAYISRMADNEYTQLLKSNVSHKAYVYAKGLLAHLPYLFQRLSDEHYTLSHGDLWINNVLRRRDKPHEMLILDWQSYCRANGLIDVVKFLRYLGKDKARSRKTQALEVYHQVLVKYGVSQYQISEIREDYYSLALPFMFVDYYIQKLSDKDRFNEMLMMLEDIVTYGNKI